MTIAFVHGPQPEPPQLDERPVALTFRSRLFNPSEGFVQAQAVELQRYQSLVAGLELVGNVHPALAGRLVLPKSRVERRLFQLSGNPEPLARQLRGRGATVLHAHFGTDGLLALPLARALGTPLVTTLRGYDINLSRGALLLSGKSTWMKYALWRRRLMREGDLFLAVSEWLRGRAIAAGYPEERTLTHYNGVDLARFHPPEHPREKGLILHVGNLVRKKGTALLLDAFAELRRQVPEARLAIIGEGPLEGTLRRQAAQAGLAGSVEFAGHKTSDEVAAWMRRASVLAAPSLTGRSGDAEGLPNVVVEAAASGLPVMATHHAGIPEAVIDGETGLLVPEGDCRSLAAALVHLLRSPDACASLGHAARRLAQAKFDGARQMARLEAHYDRLRAAASR